MEAGVNFYVHIHGVKAANVREPAGNWPTSKKFLNVSIKVRYRINTDGLGTFLEEIVGEPSPIRNSTKRKEWESRNCVSLGIY